MHPCLEHAIRYESLSSFYDDNSERCRSEEADYGCHWTLHTDPPPFGLRPRWRVSYVRATGEVYAVQLGNREAPLYVLGSVPPDEVDNNDRRTLYYATLEKILDGWAQQCAKPNSLPWVVESLNQHAR